LLVVTRELAWRTPEGAYSAAVRFCQIVDCPTSALADAARSEVTFDEALAALAARLEGEL